MRKSVKRENSQAGKLKKIAGKEARKWKKLQVHVSHVLKEEECEGAILGVSRLAPRGRTSLNQSSREDSLLAGDRLVLKLRASLVL